MYLGLGLRLGSFFKIAEAQSSIPLQGLSLWLKADAGVTVVDGVVTQWSDQSTNGYNAIPIDYEPTYIPNGINNNPCIQLSQFDDNNRSLLLLGNPMGAQASTAFVVNYVDPGVFLIDGQGGDANGALLGNFGDASDGSHWPYGLANSVYDAFATDIRKDDLGLPTGIESWNTYSVISQSNDYRLYCNGVIFYSDNNNSYSSTPRDNNLFIGMQNNSGLPQIFKGKIAEVIIYNRALGTTERQQVEAYLNTKYALY